MKRGRDDTPRLELRCSRHPTYRGIIAPRVKCRPCLKLYREENPERRKQSEVMLPGLPD